jgi:DNA-3-methyladenine glycosylase I
MPRCPWARTELDIAYHDAEWGVPSHDERHLFEMLNLEGAQAGLSWSTILAKREGYREAFEGFDPEKVALFTPARVETLLSNPRIVRNRLKVNAVLTNTRAYLKLRESGTTLDAFLWGFVDPQRRRRPIVNRWSTPGQTPAKTLQSEAMSKALAKAGFKFVGPTICYALMQATGMVNDHLLTCPRHRACVDAPTGRTQRE